MIKKKEISKGVLMTLYLEEKKTCKEIAELYEVTPSTVKARLLDHNIPIRSRSEARMISLERGLAFTRKGCVPWNKGLPRTHEEKAKMSEGQKVRYTRGILNWNAGKSLSLEIRNKISEANKGKHTGVENPFYGKHHSKETINQLSQLASERFANLAPEEKRQITPRLFSGKKPTPDEVQLISLIDKHKLPFFWNGDGKLILGGCIPDFVSTNETKLAIESYTNGRGEKYRQKRTDIFKAFGYQVVFLHDADLEGSDWEDTCLTKIQAFIAENMVFGVV